MFLSKIMRRTGLGVVTALFMISSQGFSQGSCCITSIKDSLVASLSITQGVGQVTVKPGATCDTFAISWSEFDPGMGHYMACCVLTYKLVGNDVNWTQTSSGVKTSGTITGWCQTSIEKSSILLNNEFTITAFPNPFNSQVKINFGNLIGKAVFQMFDTKGTKLYEEMINGSSEVVWKPADLKQGMYFVRVKIGEKVYSRNIICLR